MVNLEKSLVIAVINPDYYGRKVFAMFYVEEQNNESLKVLPVWDMDCTDDCKGYLDGQKNAVRELNVKDIWSFVKSLTTTQKTVFKNMGLDYRFQEDEIALERLAEKLDLERINIGYDGEDEEGSWFTCLRIPRECLPDGIYAYSLRAADDDDSQPASIEHTVTVNHYGDILTDKKLPVPIQLEVIPVEYDTDGNIIG